MLRLVCCPVLLLLAKGCSDGAPANTAAALGEARAALAAEDFDRAEQRATRIPRSSSDWEAAQLVAGEAAMKAGRLETARKHYLTLAEGSTRPLQAAEGWYYAAETSRELGQLTAAASFYRKVLAAEPDNAATHERLAFLLSTTGRRWAALPHYFHLVRSGSATLEELVLFADLDRPIERRDFLESCAQKAPDDFHVQLGLAAHDFWEGNAESAERNLRRVLDAAPELIDGQALLGELLVDRGAAQFQAWHRALPAAADEHPDIWYVRGLWARRSNNLPVAARCFWEAARRAPTHRRAMYQLGQVQSALGAEEGAEFGQRANLLIELTQYLDDVLQTHGQRPEAMRSTIGILEQTGRIWETCAWAVIARRNFPQADWPHDVLARCGGQLRHELPLTRADADLALRFDLSGHPAFRELAPGAPPAPAVPIKEEPTSPIRFSDGTGGPEFVYFNSDDPSTRGVRMFEVDGGGVAVLDFDLDGVVDLYYTQGAEWGPGDADPTPSARYTDRLFRNTFGGFVDSTDAALPGGIANTGYGQGCTVVDFDNDGFADLYVANVGRNRLYRNNGDGTFDDVTAEAGLVRRQWTASCLGVDLNADGFPDLYDVNYLEGDGIFLALCDGRACSPTNYVGARDRVFLSRGDGTFDELPDATPETGGKGMGIVALSLTSPLPALFISNDQVANFLLACHPEADRGSVRLQETGFQCGLAFNDDGLPMACMGIAADDCDGNGLTDFFVTNFSDESNTLYLQDAPGLFVDATKPSGLRAPSIPFVGWGTQFLDADRDGNPDIVLTNGNVDDYTDEGGEYHMRPQFFWNRGGRRFVELFADQLGTYFVQKHLGRGLARLDWNRDGLMDFAVSNIGAPASLVTNETTAAGTFISLKLHAVTTSRDAIGTTITVSTDSKDWTKQLLAGDGFQASNERLLQFGLGEFDGDLEVLVRWPSGAQTRLVDPRVDCTYELVEGAATATRWDGPRPAAVRVEPHPPGGETSR